MDDQMKKFCQGLAKCLNKINLEHLIQNPSLTSLLLRITGFFIIRSSLKHNYEIFDFEI